jgi:hypothetical protein
MFQASYHTAQSQQVHKSHEPRVFLIPIKLEILGEVIYWNVLETIISPEQYATELSNSLSLSLPQSYQLITPLANQIRIQADDFMNRNLLDGRNNITLTFALLKFQVVVELNDGTSETFAYRLFPSPQDESPYFTACKIVANHGISDQYIPIVSWSIMRQLCAARLSFDQQVADMNLPNMDEPSRQSQFEYQGQGFCPNSEYSEPGSQFVDPYEYTNTDIARAAEPATIVRHVKPQRKEGHTIRSKRQAELDQKVLPGSYISLINSRSTYQDEGDQSKTRCTTQCKHD